jgi:DNA-3-methyladenine glycosylase
MPLPRRFYSRPAAEVARDLVGACLLHRTKEGVLGGRIVETEAYVGPEDIACHASKGRTRRTEVMFGEPGHAYVYLIYGMYDCFNVVCQPAGRAEAVLVRALEPLPGTGACDGPGKLCRAMHVTRAHNGVDLRGDLLWIEVGEPPVEIAVTPRIGIDYAGEWVHAPLRFVDARSPHLSRKLVTTSRGTGAGSRRRARRR